MSTLLDPGQVLKDAFDDSTGALSVQSIGGTLVPQVFNQQNFTWNPDGSLAAQTYLQNGSVVAVINYTYNSSGQIISITRS